MTVSENTTVTPAVQGALSRRKLLSAAPVLAGALALPTAALAFSSRGPADDCIDALMREWRTLRFEQAAASRAILRARDALPWWARSGPSQLYADGSLAGPDVGWAADETIERPESTGFRLIRLSPYDIKRDFKFSREVWGGGSGAMGSELRARQRATYRRRMRRYIELRRAQDAEKARVGIPALEAHANALEDRSFAIEGDVLRLPDQPFAPMALGAKVVLSIAVEMSHDDHVEDGALEGRVHLAVLRALRPQLRGVVADMAGEMLDAA